jgi:ATP-dependent DNA ligase
VDKLYHKAKGGDLRQWEVWTEGADIVTRYGTVGGKLQVSRKTAEAKNVGRSNETSPEQQAVLEAKALHKHKLDRKYSLTPEEAQEQLPLPMLAHGFKGTKRKNFSYPGHTQPKLDGVRCLAQRDDDGRVVLTSRQGKPWDIPIIAGQLDKWLPDEMVLDGELYVHGESCQRITSWAKSANPRGKSYKEESSGLVYHVYDMPIIDGNDTLTWKERAEELYLSKYRKVGNNITRVPVVPVKNEEDVWSEHGLHIHHGYEGAILRGLEGTYRWGYRSEFLLKVKEFQDAEFQVTRGS